MPVQRPTPRQAEILTGLMLGDGCLFKKRPTYTPYLAIQRTLSDIGYQEWLVEEFPGWFESGIRTGSYRDSRTDQEYHFAKCVTRASPHLEDWYSRWYPNGRKIVDRNLELTPLAIAVWLCDDGNVRQAPANRARRGVLQTKFATVGFVDEDVWFLAGLMTRRYDAPFTVARDSGRLNIFASNAATRLMIAEIDGHIPSSMTRKAFWRTEAGTEPDEPKRHNWRAANTHCAQGHKWDDENTRLSKTGHRQCRTCIRLSVQRIHEAERVRARKWGQSNGWPHVSASERMPRGLLKAYRQAHA